MRSILFFVIVLCFQLHAQDPNKSAQTAGGEFHRIPGESQSITSDTYTQFVTTNEPHEEKILADPKATIYDSSKSTPNTFVYIIAFLMAGIAFFFITQSRKNKMILNNEIHLEGEEEDIRKKELWDAMAEPETE